MIQHRVPLCGRHLGKLNDVTIYPVLVVPQTVEKSVESLPGATQVGFFRNCSFTRTLLELLS